MIAPSAMVFVIDDDASMRKSLRRLLDAAHYETEVFKSASEFLSRSSHAGPSCVIVDVRMPGLNGIDFQKTLIEHGRQARAGNVVQGPDMEPGNHAATNDADAEHGQTPVNDFV